MKVNTADLTGPALDWAVAKCQGYSNLRSDPHRFANPGSLIMDPPRVEYGAVDLSELAFSTDWSHAGPILEQEHIAVMSVEDAPFTGEWAADRHRHQQEQDIDGEGGRGYSFYRSSMSFGPTPLIAAMRCFVASKLGPQVDVPAELVQAEQETTPPTPRPREGAKP